MPVGFMAVGRDSDVCAAFARGPPSEVVDFMRHEATGL